MSSRALRPEHARAGSVRPRQLRPEPTPLFPLARTPAAAPAAEARELWVGLHLPWLAIEALGPASKEPRAIVEMQGQTQFIVAVCERAEHWGVRPGMSLAGALALVPCLETQQRDLQREKQLLERLAAQAQRFTPRVSLVPPDGLVLEVKGSLHLFGGIQALCAELDSECRNAGVKPLLALAPFPLAALAGARSGKSFVVTKPAHLVGQISSLPLVTLRWSADVLHRLRQIGVYTVGEALRLPRAGFARRFGKAQLAMLDRLTGRDADLRAAFKVRERFRRKHELLYELEHHEPILARLEPLIHELGAFLRARQCGITRLDCLLQHRHAPVTRCALKLAAPAANATHLLKLMGERLAALTLPEPVRAFELRSGWLVSRPSTTESLWRPGEHGGGANPESAELIEQLRARLGYEAVYGIQIVESYRPESAWKATDLRSPQSPGGLSKLPWAAFRRPTWLLRVPKQLRERDGMPRRRGALQLLRGPERIETAWWDGGDITRDYYMARDIHGVRLWIFRERSAPHRWFLHGVFG